MPYRLDWDKGGVFSSVTGTMVDADLLGLVTEICEDPRFDDLKFCIVDASQADGFVVNENHVLTSGAALIGAAFSNARVVVAVISSQAASHALCGRLVEIGAMPFPPAVFPDVGMARRWIDAEMPYRHSWEAAADVARFRHW